MTDQFDAKGSAEFTYMPDQRSQSVPSPKWVRVYLGGHAIADSKGVILLRSTERTPVYYFPQEDVRMDALFSTDHQTHSPELGEARYWTVRVGGKDAENAAWSYTNPPENASGLKGRIAFEWDKMDAWFEEDEKVFAHPHDPFHRIDVRHSSRHVRVVIDGVSVAETQRPVLLFETGLPTRYYFPHTDVRLDLLLPGEKETWCAYKGKASHYSLKIDGQVVRDIAWSYPFPSPEYAKIQNLICFYNERLDKFYVDSQIVAKPKTPWSED